MSAYRGNIITRNPATPTGPAEDGTAPGIWTLSEAMAFKRQGIWPTQGVQGRDAYFNYVSMLLSTTSLGNANNNLFVDTSGAFTPVSRNANTTQGSFTPYSPNWSYYFNGSSTITFPQQTLDGDFTIEAWVYYNDNSTQPTLIGRNGGSPLANDQALRRILVSGNGRHYFYDYATGFSLTGSINILPFTWTHLAVTRSGTTTRIFTNGVLDNSGTWSGSFDYFCVGGVDTSNDRLNGYASNVRVVDGTAVYTSNFTPPTTPLTAIAGTELLICQSNRFRDAGPNNLTLTINGSPAVSKFSPYSPGSPGITYNQSNITNWSNYFDGNGDYLTVPSSSAFNYGTGDFTIECWGYRGSSSNFWCAYSASGVSFTLFSYAGASETIQVYSNGFYNSGINPGFNTWFHVAVTRSSGTLRIFINGVQGFSGSYTTNIPSHEVRIGSSIANEWGLGNVSNLRVVKGTALYTSNFTPPTTNLTAVSGTSLLTCQNASFADNSANNFVITPTGNATVTGNSPFNPTGYWSVSGTSTQGVTIPQTTATDLGSGSFTLECWVNISDYSGGGIVTKRRTDTALTGSWGMFVTGSGFLNFQGVGWASSYTASTGAIPLNSWTHLAVSRSGSNLSMFVNGVRVVNVSDSYDYTCSTYTIIKLAGNAGGNYPSGGALFGGIIGAISNLRIVQGVAVYNPASSSFTVPTSPLTAINSTSLLTLQNGTMKDNSANNNTNILLYSGASIQSFDPFYTTTIPSNGGSTYFDGSSDWLSAPNSVANFGAGSFTAECWVYFNSNTAGYQPIMDNAGTGDSQGWVIILETNNTLNAYTSNGSSWTWNITTSYVPPARAWLHIALVRNGGTMTLYANGVSLGTSNISTNAIHSPSGAFYAGYYPYFPGGARTLNGYITDVRLTPGTAIYTSAFTPPTAPLAPVANTTLLLNGTNAGIYDATVINDMETVGNAQVTTAVSKFGGSSVAFDGSGDYLSIPAAPTTIFAGSFTVEFWINFSAIPSNFIILFAGTTANTQFFITTKSNGTGLRFGLTGVAEYATATQTWSTGQWYHVALVRNGTDVKFYVNGTNVSDGTYTNSNTYSGILLIGGGVAGVPDLSGYMDDVRITNGVARYTSNFTPPTQAFPTF